ncbi:DUF2500 domain-containing protein [Paenibacillus thermoaerophilus]|uniref:DUF2500 domain-containing protein n=1 Tax=Paenibacillus thermoaerophilus TaxID=1215385 RepID=A0ABW2V435_9BACL|nr:DUF2500 domain-containing protein [Paenibacillus thermoaerophilus]TMV18304.1 DUF2500 domain-containing protein [Paenibacillus thermoaerophilus]
MFTIVPIFILIGFAVVIGAFVFNGARYIQNARAPKETVYAKVAAKRLEVTGRTNLQHPGNAAHPVRTTRTHYYITLEFDNGERREYLDVRNLYGLVVEGDEGCAAVQGDWIVAFERKPD